MSSAFNPAVNPGFAGVFVLTRPSSLNFGPQLENFSVSFPAPPDSTDISQYVQYPPAFKVNDAYSSFDQIETDQAWISVDARNNAPVTITNSFLGSFNHGAWLAVAGDWNYMSNIEFACGASCTTNNLTAQLQNAIGVQVDDAWLSFSSVLTYNYSIGLYVTAGYVQGNSWGFDGSLGGVWTSGGNVEISNCYFTGPAQYAVNATGGNTTISSCTLTASVNPSTNALFRLNNAYGGVDSLKINDLSAVLPTDGVLISQDSTLGASSLIFSNSMVSANCSACSLPLISIGLNSSGGLDWSNLTGNIIYASGSSRPLTSIGGATTLTWSNNQTQGNWTAIPH